MDIKKRFYGKTVEGKDVDLFTLTNAKGMQVGILTYGGIITFLKVPDKDGKLVDIVLGFDDLSGYESSSGTYFGALIGRHANRICKGQFTLGGSEYTLPCNSNGHHLHGGNIGFDKRVWDACIRDNQLVLSLVSCNGEEGYPGTLKVSVTHSLSEDGEFIWEYYAETDKETICNLTNHSYFNLSGHDSGTVLDQVLQIESDSFTESDSGLIPTGNMLKVEGTPMDFRTPHAIGERIGHDYQPLKLAGGYDHNYAIRGNTGSLRDAASGYDNKSGISFKLKTTLPGVQLYTGNFLEGMKGKNGARYMRNSGFCLETQYFPDAVNHTNFEQPTLKPGDKYHHITSIKFDTIK
ncbi:MAG TPA: galactose-1-epimerase [Ruminococcaceae bacterium]|nr:galactose-1-epimerase [Oscillospiraceae bacterium]